MGLMARTDENNNALTVSIQRELWAGKRVDYTVVVPNEEACSRIAEKKTIMGRAVIEVFLSLIPKVGG